MDYTLPGSTVHGILCGKNTGVVAIPLFPEIFPYPEKLNPGLALQTDSLHVSHQGKPIVGVGDASCHLEVFGHFSWDTTAAAATPVMFDS